MHFTSTEGSMPHAIAGAMQRRASSGMGNYIATPYFPYDVNSVWNRNQLGGLGDIGIGTLAIVGLVAYLMFAKGSIARRIF